MSREISARPARIQSLDVDLNERLRHGLWNPVGVQIEIRAPACATRRWALEFNAFGVCQRGRCRLATEAGMRRSDADMRASAGPVPTGQTFHLRDEIGRQEPALRLLEGLKSSPEAEN